MSTKKLATSLSVIILVLLTIIWLHTQWAKQSPMQVKEYGVATISKIKVVYDGDTFSANIDGWPPIIGDSVSVRISGIDTPEMNSTNPKIRSLAILARNELRNMLMSAKRIELRGISRDKYFRINAYVYINDDQNVGDILLSKKMAKKYDGGTKLSWTLKDYKEYEKLHK
jgi:micrococcal nuclease